MQGLGFKIRGPILKSDESAPFGRALGTEPTAGAPLAGGDEVTITVSSGPEQRHIPDCARRSIDDCVRSLADAGFLHRQQWPTMSATVPRDAVVATVPAAGAPWAISDDVAVIISAGPEKLRVPDVAGQSVDQATSILKGAGFSTILSGTVDSTLAVGRVVSTDPSPGTNLSARSAVMLKVSRGDQFSMPNLRGMTCLDVVPVLRSLGHQGRLLNAGDLPGPDDKANRVVKQDPPPGVGVSRDSPIVLSYGA